MPKDKARALLCLNMKRLRALRGMTGDALAEKVGLAGNSIRRIETGRSWPTSRTLNAIAKALRVPVGELLVERKS